MTESIPNLGTRGLRPGVLRTRAWQGLVSDGGVPNHRRPLPTQDLAKQPAVGTRMRPAQEDNEVRRVRAPPDMARALGQRFRSPCTKQQS